MAFVVTTERTKKRAAGIMAAALFVIFAAGSVFVTRASLLPKDSLITFASPAMALYIHANLDQMDPVAANAIIQEFHIPAGAKEIAIIVDASGHYATIVRTDTPLSPVPGAFMTIGDRTYATLPMVASPHPFVGASRLAAARETGPIQGFIAPSSIHALSFPDLPPQPLVFAAAVSEGRLIGRVFPLTPTLGTTANPAPADNDALGLPQPILAYRGPLSAFGAGERLLAAFDAPRSVLGIPDSAAYRLERANLIREINRYTGKVEIAKNNDTLVTLLAADQPRLLADLKNYLRTAFPVLGQGKDGGQEYRLGNGTRDIIMVSAPNETEVSVSGFGPVFAVVNGGKAIRIAKSLSMAHSATAMPQSLPTWCDLSEPSMILTEEMQGNAKIPHAIATIFAHLGLSTFSFGESVDKPSIFCGYKSLSVDN